MANLKASKKDIRKTKRRHELNSYQRARLRTLAKKVQYYAEEGERGDTLKSLAEYISYLDKAGRRHLIHPRQASRRKGRMTVYVNKTLAEVTQEEIDNTLESPKAEAPEEQTESTSVNPEVAEETEKTDTE